MVHRGMNPARTPVTAMFNYMNYSDLLQGTADDADTGSRWWEQHG